MLVKEPASKRSEFQGRHLTLSHMCITVMSSGLYMGMGFIHYNNTCNVVIVLYISQMFLLICGCKQVRLSVQMGTIT